MGLAMEVATLTAKGQITVPKAVRDALGLRQGDRLSWELEDGSVRVPFPFTDRQAQKRPSFAGDDHLSTPIPPEIRGTQRAHCHP